MQEPQNMKDYGLFGTFGREAVRGNCWKSTLEPDCPFYDLLRNMDFFFHRPIFPKFWSCSYHFHIITIYNA